jgi:cytochrome b6-f complex iron-sulfur subunit
VKEAEEQSSAVPGVLKKEMSRRDFIDWVIKGGILATLSGMLFPALAYLWPVMGHGPKVDMEEVAALEEIPVGGSKKIVLAGSALLLIRTPQEIKAFSAICTHLGCVVDWDGLKREIVCPCHAGIFDLEGRVVSGPPPRPLPSYPVKVMNGKVFIKL